DADDPAVHEAGELGRHRAVEVLLPGGELDGGVVDGPQLVGRLITHGRPFVLLPGVNPRTARAASHPPMRVMWHYATAGAVARRPVEAAVVTTSKSWRFCAAQRNANSTIALSNVSEPPR